MPIDRDTLLSALRRHLLTILTVSGVLAGVALGYILRSLPRNVWWTHREILYLQFPGDIYLRLLTMFIIPLLVTSVIGGVAALNIQTSWKVAARSAVWFIGTEYMAVVIGVALAATIGPGYNIKVDNYTVLENPNILPIDTSLDIFRNVFPENYIKASIAQEQTRLIDPRNESIPKEAWAMKTIEIEGVNIPGLITFGITLGLAIGISLPAGKSLLTFCDVTNKCMMMAIGWVVKLTPIAVLFMIAAKLLEDEDLSGLGERLGLYFLTVLIGLSVHSLMALPALYFAFTRKSPFKLLGQMMQALVTAFGTASSNATLPITMRCLEKRAGLDGRLVRFIAPVATVLNMDGTALYEAVAVVFISQLRGIPMTFSYLFLISITVTAACIGNAGIPQAGLVTMVLILGSLGLPPEDVTLIVTVDWLLDRFRTTVNVASDIFAAGVVEHLSRDELTDFGHRKYSEVPQLDDEEYELNLFRLFQAIIKSKEKAEAAVKYLK